MSNKINKIDTSPSEFYEHIPNRGWAPKAATPNKPSAFYDYDIGQPVRVFCWDINFCWDHKPVSYGGRRGYCSKCDVDLMLDDDHNWIIEPTITNWDKISK